MKKVFIYIFSLLFLVPADSSEINPQTFIDSNAQSMVQVIVNNQDPVSYTHLRAHET